MSNKSVPAAATGLPSSNPSSRRGFLRNLASLPMIGGGVTLIGDPVRADVEITRDLLESYNTWLQRETSWLAWERAKGDYDLCRFIKSVVWVDCPAGRFHCSHRDREEMPSARAAVVLSAVGCGW